MSLQVQDKFIRDLLNEVPPDTRAFMVGDPAKALLPARAAAASQGARQSLRPRLGQRRLPGCLRALLHFWLLSGFLSSAGCRGRPGAQAVYAFCSCVAPPFAI